MKFVEEIREELRKMEKDEVFLFIISLLSRQKTFFDQIASINNWCENEIISSVYNEVTIVVEGSLKAGLKKAYIAG